MLELKFRQREFSKETFIGNGYQRGETSSSGPDAERTDYLIVVSNRKYYGFPKAMRRTWS
jgi:hypothetical protein